MRVNVYDFDNTIYRGNSSVDFYLYCVYKKPTILRHLPRQIFHVFLYKMHLEDKTSMKNVLFVFLKDFKRIDLVLKSFWKTHFKKIKNWYLDKDNSKDVIISASPEFLLLPAAKKIGVYKLIATKMNKKTGKISGQNCFGEEKVKRFKCILSRAEVLEAYSDSISDLPILKMSIDRYIVRGNRMISLADYKRKYL